MEPEMPTDFAYWKELAAIAGFGALWFKNGRDVGKVEEQVQALHDADYCTKEHCEQCRDFCANAQNQHREQMWSQFLLAIEKRDREFDRKFSQICSGISEIKAEIKKQ